MRTTNRAIRRHHIARLKKTRKHYWHYPDRFSGLPDEPPGPPQEMDEKQLGRVVQYPQICSCAGCCNVRRAPNMSDGHHGRTLPERIQIFDLEEWKRGDS
jgi:hypothetical protein